jgi:hypothetical protein
MYRIIDLFCTLNQLNKGLACVAREQGCSILFT